MIRFFIILFAISTFAIDWAIVRIKENVQVLVLFGVREISMASVLKSNCLDSGLIRIPCVLGEVGDTVKVYRLHEGGNWIYNKNGERICR